jgi:hypothetical protein
MSAVGDLTELVERAAAAERAALASKWRERRDVEALGREARRAFDEQRVLERGSAKAHELTGRRARLREASFLTATSNLVLIWWVFAAQELSSRLGGAIVPAILVIVSSVVMWLLLTVFAVALSPQPKVRRALLREITDDDSNAEARAFAEEAARERVTTPAPAGSSVRERAE